MPLHVFKELHKQSYGLVDPGLEAFSSSEPSSSSGQDVDIRPLLAPAAGGLPPSGVLPCASCPVPGLALCITSSPGAPAASSLPLWRTSCSSRCCQLVRPTWVQLAAAVHPRVHLPHLSPSPGPPRSCESSATRRAAAAAAAAPFQDPSPQDGFRPWCTRAGLHCARGRFGSRSMPRLVPL